MEAAQLIGLSEKSRKESIMFGHDFLRSLTAFNAATAAAANVNGMDTAAAAAAVTAAAGPPEAKSDHGQPPPVLEVRIRQVTSEDHVQIVKLFQVGNICTYYSVLGVKFVK